jgi:hypothetical protein
MSLPNRNCSFRIRSPDNDESVCISRYQTGILAKEIERVDGGGVATEDEGRGRGRQGH